MSKLTIGIILKEGYTPEIGGGFSYYDSIVEAIDNYNFHEDLDFHFISFHVTGDSKLKKKLKHINIHDHHTASEKLIFAITQKLNKYPFFQRSTIIKNLKRKLYKRERKHLRRALIAEKVDILYNIIPYAQFLDYPFVDTHWDIGHLSMFAFPEVALNGSFESRDTYYSQWISKAFAIFCESAAGKEELLLYKPLNPERVFVVPMFAGKITEINLTGDLIDSILNKYSLEAQKFFYYPAQFWSHKNHYGLLMAFSRFSRENPGIKMVFSGSDKGNLDYIKTVINDLNLNNEVILAGFVSIETVYALYKNAISLVMPSYLGPTNLPLLEAQAVGCPVICNDFKGHRELLTSGAHIFVAPDDYDGWCNAMKTMYTSRSPGTGVLNKNFNRENCMKSIEDAFLKIKNARKTFGLNFKQL